MDGSGDHQYPPPIIITHESGMTRVEVDAVVTDFPDDIPIPTEAPDVACRVFRALMSDLRSDLRAE